MKGLLDTSVLIARERGRPLGTLPDESAISVVTLAELHMGVLLAEQPRVRARRMRSLSEVERNFDAVPIDKEVARSFAMLVADARSRGRKPKIMDAWIAATAVTYDLPLFTQDADFGQFPDVEVVQV